MEGFTVPIHRSVTQPVLLGGAPREFAILNCTLSSMIVLSLHSLLGIPIGIGIHMLGAFLAKNDPQFLETFKRHLHHKRYYGV